MEMDAPESMEVFREELRSHYTQFPRFTSKLVKNGKNYNLEPVTDQAVLDDQVRIHEESLDFEGMEKLMAKEIKAHIKND